MPKWRFLHDGSREAALVHALLGSRFTPVRLLKQGAGVSTWLARDGELQVVLKTASRSKLGGAWLRVRHEAQVLQSLDSPWVAPILEGGRPRMRSIWLSPFSRARPSRRSWLEAYWGGRKPWPSPRLWPGPWRRFTHTASATAISSRPISSGTRGS